MSIRPNASFGKPIEIAGFYNAGNLCSEALTKFYRYQISADLYRNCIVKGGVLMPQNSVKRISLFCFQGAASFTTMMQMPYPDYTIPHVPSPRYQPPITSESRYHFFSVSLYVCQSVCQYVCLLMCLHVSCPFILSFENIVSI
jgi:hypothetical protein